MATDDERREVAERLREFTKDNQWPLTVGGNSSTIRHAISDIVFGDKKYHSGVDLLDRLADLIEPESGHESGQCPDSVQKGPVCDRDALLALADEIEDNDVTYCVSTQYVLDSYACRIRKACGLVEGS